MWSQSGLTKACDILYGLRTVTLPSNQAGKLITCITLLRNINESFNLLGNSTISNDWTKCLLRYKRVEVEIKTNHYRLNLDEVILETTKSGITIATNQLLNNGYTVHIVSCMSWYIGIFGIDEGFAWRFKGKAVVQFIIILLVNHAYLWYSQTCSYMKWLIINIKTVLKSNLSWEATPFAQWKWPQKADGLKSEVAFVLNYHKSFWPSGRKTKGGLSSQ